LTTEQRELSYEEAAAFLREAEEAFATADVDRILSAFDPDIVIRYADFPEMNGIDEARRWLESRFARQCDYSLRKRLHAVSGSTLGGSWEGEWQDAKTGQQMEGRGVEVQTLRNGKVTEWIAAFNAWPHGGRADSPLV
jgi:nuclear transport factor 2 (NTF2) superfamily protein